MSGVIFLVVAAVIVIFVIGIYNKLVRMRNEVKNSFSQIDVQLKRRYDLIPNLVETAKGYMQHERQTLEGVIQARNSAFAIAQAVAQNPTSGDGMKQLVGAEGMLSQLMSKFVALSESYPDLKANTTMQSLMEELSSTENKVSFARQAYNDSVMTYNNGREVFPNSMIAGMFKFDPATSFEITNVTEKEAPKVTFN